MPAPFTTKKELRDARARLTLAIEAAYCRRDEYGLPDRASLERRADREALKRLIATALAHIDPGVSHA